MRKYGFCGIAAIMILSSSALGGIWPRSGGSGHIPTPYENLNRKVELADGERYVLQGKVVFRKENTAHGTREQAYFQVNLDVHPWLASEMRKKFPYYPLLGPTWSWQQYRGMKIELVCQAAAKFQVQYGVGPVQMMALTRVEGFNIEVLRM